MADTKFKAEWGRNQSERRKIEKQISDVKESIASYEQKKYKASRIRELAGTMKEILQATGTAFLNEKRQVFEGLNLKVWVEHGDLHALELSLPVSLACNNVSTHR
jgi:hypothetical protein